MSQNTPYSTAKAMSTKDQADKIWEHIANTCGIEASADAEPWISFCISPETLNHARQTPCCYAAYLGKRLLSESLIKAFGGETVVDVYGFCALDYLDMNNPIEEVILAAQKRDRLTLLSLSFNTSGDDIEPTRGVRRGELL